MRRASAGSPGAGYLTCTQHVESRHQVGKLLMRVLSVALTVRVPATVLNVLSTSHLPSISHIPKPSQESGFLLALA